MFHKGFLESEFDWTGYLLSVTLPKCLEYFEIIWTRIPPKKINKYWSKDQRMVTTSFPAMFHIMPPYQHYCCLNHQTPSQVPVARNSASSTSRSSSPWVKLLTSRCALVIFQDQTWGLSHQKWWFHHEKWGFFTSGVELKIGFVQKGWQWYPKMASWGSYMVSYQIWECDQKNSIHQDNLCDYNLNRITNENSFLGLSAALSLWILLLKNGIWLKLINLVLGWLNTEKSKGDQVMRCYGSIWTPFWVVTRNQIVRLQRLQGSSGQLWLF